MTKARNLADLISDGVIGTTELADDVITPVQLSETGNYVMSQLNVNGTVTSDGLTVDGGGSRQYINSGHLRLSDSYNLEWGGGTNAIQGSNASNHILFKTNNVESMRIDSSGRVGITTSSPAYKLDVNGSLSSNGSENVMRIAAADSTQAGGVNIHSVYGNTNNDRVTTLFSIDGQNQASPLAFGTGSTESMRIDSSGNLLVGKASSSTTTAGNELRSGGLAAFTRSGSYALNLNRLSSDGDIAVFQKDGSTVGSIGSNAAGGIPVLDINTNSSSGIMRMLTSGSEAMRIDSGGNVSINSSNAEGAKLKVADTQDAVTYPLFLQNRTNTGNSAVGIRFIATGSSVSDGQFAAIRATNALGAGSTANDLEFLTCGSGGTPAVRMVIDAAGRVTMPSQPVFTAYQYDTGTNDEYPITSGDGTLVANSTAINRGSIYNDTNGRFTAPVSGVYHITFNLSLYVEDVDVDNSVGWGLYVNGSRYLWTTYSSGLSITQSTPWVMGDGTGGGNNTLTHAAEIGAPSYSANISLSQNDYVQVGWHNLSRSLGLRSFIFSGHLIA